MADLQFIDCSEPLKEWPVTDANNNRIDGIAFYIGGDTPHVWTPAELETCPYRFRLPVYVRSNPANANPHADAAEIILALQETYLMPKGCLVALDTETSQAPEYVKTIFTYLTASGDFLIDYGSQNYLFGNQNPSGYYWGAEWQSPPRRAVIGGDVMTQYAVTNAYDESVAQSSLPFWDTSTMVFPDIPPGQWNDPEKWVWQHCIIVGQGTNGYLYSFTYNPKTGLWGGETEL